MTDDDQRQLSRAELDAMSEAGEINAINAARHAGRLDDVRAGYLNDLERPETWGPALMRQAIVTWWQSTEAGDA